ncbi:MAG: hypothetical protein LKH76_10090 [Acetobacter fabarum]|jgi:hypothetical protein|uniref:hypothetical protein n=1 Tax=Acetobacter fabarum TaxID=483199 RepID=UPI00242D6804|nr:hypothetical protein [Acetobacter fabarum]MCH4025248.1 hypothetical protein [Acetobacter fabarum]MCH4055104.1 hypothetical protein [Acetobacter fabarum]MCH4128887.1 hypothetical protein [Acetobacter fabarum]MCH4142076.1 hypothetical protein [Acetobacter fabarum]MCI1393801.1 hypothetical protein [Acetobacter fabarum]
MQVKPFDLNAAKSGLDDDRKERDRGKGHELSDARRETVEVEGRAKFFFMRSIWSWCIIAWISVLIIFNCSLALFIGIGYLDYTKYRWFITSVTVETFLQIVGMGYIAVKFLFSSGK